MAGRSIQFFTPLNSIVNNKKQPLSQFIAPRSFYIYLLN